MISAVVPLVTDACLDSSRLATLEVQSSGLSDIGIRFGDQVKMRRLCQNC